MLGQPNYFNVREQKAAPCDYYELITLELIMKKLFAIIFLLFFGANTAFAVRCGNNLVSIGDLKNEVLINCGEPFSREIIGYIDQIETETIKNEKSEKRIRVMNIEEWILEVTNYGTTYYHSLLFEGNELKEIKPAGQKQIK